MIKENNSTDVIDRAAIYDLGNQHYSSPSWLSEYNRLINAIRGMIRNTYFSPIVLNYSQAKL